MDHRTDSEVCYGFVKPSKKGTQGVTERTKFVTIMKTAKKKSGWEDGEQMGSTWPAILDRFLIRCFTRARRRGRVFSTDTLQESMTKASAQVRVTYYTSDSSRNSQEPKETKWTPVSTMGGSSKSGTEDDEQGGAHKGNLAANPVTN